MDEEIIDPIENETLGALSRAERAIAERTDIAEVKSSNASELMQMIKRMVDDPQFDVAKLQALLDVKERWDAIEAKKDYDTAFAAFKANAARIVKNKLVGDGPLKGRRYADLFAVVDALVPQLSAHGLSHSWSIIKDEKDWIEVECILSHVGGHAERRKMGGPPDAGGAKNAIQARASTVSYLERYTFLAAVGMTSADSDDDGRGAPETPEDRPSPWTIELLASAAAAAENKKYEAWWKQQPQGFRQDAIKTQQHADFRAKDRE